eukprot:TRINITY_DN22329_c0_g1_i1.p1 TRINITY_DN22329_c0_g1~~TRINITY_DN22329_c0_g1_i1.p1  ORF type:complete len:106 (-),score=11.71 TRINITY_DN22329_c0_g1_i1:220-537(-)
MFVASVAHFWVFPYAEFHDPEREAYDQFDRVGSILNPKDIIHDMRSHIVDPAKKSIQQKRAKVRSFRAKLCEPCCDAQSTEMVTTEPTTPSTPQKGPYAQLGEDQ